MKKTDEGSDKDRSNIALVLLGIITLALLIAFIWHYITAKPPESELHTRPAGYLWHRPADAVNLC
ncbi:MAG: hypothetical protein K2X77_10720 [Candidatus Obscuribacterales bacterium]|jgi:hypothetical protein|nr:hypothetical protein [Candidatus Obscuribacterales bacterium]